MIHLCYILSTIYSVILQKCLLDRLALQVVGLFADKGFSVYIIHAVSILEFSN